MLTYGQIEDNRDDLVRALRRKQPMLTKAEIKAIRADLARARHVRYNRSAKGRRRALQFNATDRGRARTRRYEATAWRREYKQTYAVTGCTPYAEDADLFMGAMAPEMGPRMRRRRTRTVNVICSGCHHGARGHFGQRHVPVRNEGE